MEKSVSRGKFLLFTFLLITFLGGELLYLSSRPKHSQTLKDFLSISKFFAPSLYTDTAYLRYRDFHNADILFSYHPALRESKIGAFIYKAPVQ